LILDSLKIIQASLLNPKRFFKLLIKEPYSLKSILIFVIVITVISQLPVILLSGKALNVGSVFAGLAFYSFISIVFLFIQFFIFSNLLKYQKIEINDDYLFNVICISSAPKIFSFIFFILQIPQLALIILIYQVYIFYSGLMVFNDKFKKNYIVTFLIYFTFIVLLVGVVASRFLNLSAS